MLLVVTATDISRQLNAMNWRNACHKVQPLLTETETIMLEGSRASDFQIYQILSVVTKDNPQLYLPNDVTKSIALNACEITEKFRAECYKKYGAWICSPDAILTFIKDRLHQAPLKNIMDHHTAIVTILKTCLNYSSKSLSEIKNLYSDTVIHYLSIRYSFNLDFVKIIFLVAGDQAWDLITTKNCNGNTALHYQLHSSAIKDLLSMASSPEQAWSLINTPNYDGHTPLSLAMKCNVQVIEILEFYRPKEQ